MMERRRQHRSFFRTLILAALPFLTLSLQAQPDGSVGEKPQITVPQKIADLPLLNVDRETFTVADIARAYAKAPGKDATSFYELSKDSALSFVNLYADFRLKVLAAKKKGLDRLTDFQADMSQNRDQVALGIGPYGSVSGDGFLFQREVVDPGVQRIWGRRANEYMVSVIFIAANPADAADTLRAYQKAKGLLSNLMKGGDFAMIASKESDDPQSKIAGGSLGWSTGGMFPREIEEAVMATPAGSIYPDVVRLANSGYVIVKVVDRQPRVKVRLAHIVFETKASLGVENPKEVTRQRAEAALARIKNGEAFDKVAREVSDERTTAETGGDLLAWYTRSLGFETRPGKLPKQFEEAAYSLKDGEISGVIEDGIGYRIVKRISSMKPRFEDEEKALRDIYRRYFFETDRNLYIDTVLIEQGFRVDPSTLEFLIQSVDTTRTAADRSWASKFPEGLYARPFFTVGDRSWTVQDFVDSIETNPRYRALPLSRTGIMDGILAMVEYTALKKEAENLETKYPEFARLMQDFNDGALIFGLEQQEIYSKVSYNDEVGREYFEKHRNDYMTEPRLALTEVFVYTEDEAKAIYDRAKDGADMNAIAREKTQRQGYREQAGRWPINDAKHSAMVRQVIEHADGDLKQGKVLKPFPNENAWSVVRIDGYEAPKPMSFEEARGELMGDYNDWKESSLRSTMIASLRKEYKVDINKKNLESALSVR